MKCPKCDNKLLYDSLTEEYYCDTCNKLYTKEEVEEPVNVRLLLSSIICWIPILNMIILKISRKKPIEYRQTYYNLFISSLMMHLILIVLLSIGYVKYRDARIFDIKRTFYENAIEWSNKHEYSIDNSTILKLAEKVPEFEPVITLSEMEESKNDFTEELLGIFDGSIISGEHVRYLMNEYPEYGYLIQTKNLRVKYQNVNVYHNIGRYFKDESVELSEEFRIIDCSLNDTFTLLTKTKGFEQIDNKKTIYYVYNTEMFKVKILYNKHGKVVGLSFTESEV